MVKIKIIVEGGKASTSPAMAQTLGPMKINLGEVIGSINEKTKAFVGVKVPVEIDVNEKTKAYEIEVGSPSTTELIKKEMGISKGSGTPDKIKAGNIGVEQIIKIAKMKKEGMFDRTLKSAVKTIAGSCNSLGILIEGMISSEFNLLVEEGKYDKEIEEKKSEMEEGKENNLKEQLKDIQVELDAMNKKKVKEEEKKEEGEEEKK